MKPGETLNREGKNGSDKPKRLYTHHYELTGESVVPEFVRLIMNIKIRAQQATMVQLAERLGFPAETVKSIKALMKVEALPKGIIWAAANSLRMHMEAVLEGNVNAAQELRESIDGRATMRVEDARSNDRLQLLLDEFREARRRPPTAPAPASNACEATQATDPTLSERCVLELGHAGDHSWPPVNPTSAAT